MPMVRPTQSHHRDPAPPSQTGPAAAAVNCGCGLLFLIPGLMPLLALLNLLPRDQYFGGQSPLLPVLGGLPFIAVGLYFLVNAVTLLISKRRLPQRLLFNLGVFFLAIPFHYWLFFGKRGGESVTSINLPGGAIVSFLDRGTLSFILAKIAMAILLVVIDLFLISEFLGRNWFAYRSGEAEDEAGNRGEPRA